MITDTKLIEKTGDTIVVTMNDDFQFQILMTPGSEDPHDHLVVDLAGDALTLTAAQQDTADLVCKTMCHIKHN